MMDRTRGLRVLVVDDNRDAADSLSRLIHFWGHTVRTAYDESAVQVARDFQPHVALLDLAMPRMDGASMALRIREQASPGNLLIVAVTGFHDDETRRTSRAAGIDQFMVKPVDLAALERLLNSQCSAREPTVAPAPPRAEP